jgi:glycosyltransferase involved in cell wall biosynthesis
MYKIAMDARPLSTRVSGVGRLIAETLLHFPDKQNYEFHLFSHLPIHETHKKVLELPNIVTKIGKGFFSKKGGLYFLVTFPLEIRNGKYDLFWGSQQVAPLFLPSQLPVVLTYCDLVLYLYPDTMRKIAALQQRFFQKYSVQRANFILSISENTRQDQINYFHYPTQNTAVAYPGIDLKEVWSFLNQNPSAKIQNLPNEFILSVSTIEPRKNYAFLLEAFREYRKIHSGRSLPWVIIGKRGWEKREFFLELEKDIQTFKDIYILEDINDIDLHHAYFKASLFLFGSKYEGFGIPLLEALAHKKKALVSDIPTFREIGKDQISYLPLEEPKRWGEEIARLLSSDLEPDIDLDFFSWENSALETKKAFDRFLTQT